MFVPEEKKTEVSILSPVSQIDYLLTMFNTPTCTCRSPIKSLCQLFENINCSVNDKNMLLHVAKVYCCSTSTDINPLFNCNNRKQL